MPTTLKAFREDGTEVRPGDTISMIGIEHTFRAATVVSNAARTSGMIAVDGYPDMYAAPFGLTVRAVPDDEPAWEDYSEQEPGAIRRDIRGPGGFEARVGPRGGWLIIDTSDGETVTGGIARDRVAGKLAVAEWERMHVPASPARPELAWYSANTGTPGDKQRDLDVPRGPEAGAGYWAVIGPNADGSYGWTVVDGINGDDVASAPADDEASAMDAVAAWEDAARAEWKSALPAGNEPAPDASRMAPPVPGVTANTGHTVYAVLPAGRHDRWWVAMRSDRERVTWEAETCPDGTLAYNAGHYHTSGAGADAEALADLADRAGIFEMLTSLSAGAAAREAFRESYDRVLEELSGTYGVGKARIRDGLLEAAALGSATLSWHDRGEPGRRRDYGIRYDRYRCVFTWHRES